MEWVWWAVVVGIILLVTVLLLGFVHHEIEYSRHGEDDLFR